MHRISWREGIRTLKVMYPVYLSVGVIFFILGTVIGQYTIVTNLAVVTVKTEPLLAFLDLMYGTVIIGVVFSFAICASLLVAVTNGVIELKQSQLFTFRVLGFSRLALTKYLTISTLPLFIFLGLISYSLGTGLAPVLLKFMSGITGLVFPRHWSYAGIFLCSFLLFLGTFAVILWLFFLKLEGKHHKASGAAPTLARFTRLSHQGMSHSTMSYSIMSPSTMSPRALSNKALRYRPQGYKTLVHKVLTWVISVGAFCLYCGAYLPFAATLYKGKAAFGGDIRNVVNYALLASVLALLGMFFLLPRLLKGVLALLRRSFSARASLLLVSRSLLFHVKFISRLQFPLLTATGLWCSLAGFALIFGPSADALYQVHTAKTSVGEMFSLFFMPLLAGLLACIALLPAYAKRRVGELVSLQVQGFSARFFRKQALLSGLIFFITLVLALVLLLLPGTMTLLGGLRSYSAQLYGLSGALQTLGIVLGGLAIYAAAFTLIQLKYQPKTETTLKTLREKP